MIYKFIVCLAVAATVALGSLAVDINGKSIEKEELIAPPGVPAKPENSSSWKNLYPRQYETWKMTRKSTETGDMMAKSPDLVILRAGTDDVVGPNLLELRGHYYSVLDFSTAGDSGIPTDVEYGKDGTSSRCLLCHTSNASQLMARDGKEEFLSSSWTRYKTEALNPIGCVNCHDPADASLRMGPTGVNEAMVAAGLPSFENSSYNEKRRLVCAQCHTVTNSTYIDWIDKSGKQRKMRVTTLPWKNGLTLDEMEQYYNDGRNFPDGQPYYDYIHPISRTKIIFPEHTDYELFIQGTHGKRGLACPDCHMPYTQQGGVKFTDHKIGNPLDAINRTCQTCHRKSEEFLRNAVEEKRQRRDVLTTQARKNLALAHLEAGKAWESGATEEEMAPILANIRSSYWQLNSVARAAFFHAPEQTLKALADSNSKALNARLGLANVLASHGVNNWKAPTYSTEAEAFALLNLKDRTEYIKRKCQSIEEMKMQWIKKAMADGTYDEDISYPENIETWYTRECKSNK